MGTLSSNKEIYRAIVEAQTELICRFLPDGTLTFVNPAYCRYFAKTETELLGQNWIDLVPEPEGAKIPQYLGSFSWENSVATIEHSIINAEGEIRIQEWKDHAFFDADKNLIEFMSVGRDITERKSMENTLRKSQNLFQKIADTSPTLIYIYDIISHQNIYVNHQIEKSLGYTPDEIETMNSAFLFTLMHPEDMAKYPQVLKKLSNLLEGELHEHDFRMRHKKGEWRFFHTREVIFSRNSDGVPQQIFGIAEDITEGKKAEEALRVSEERYRTLVANFPHGAVFLFDHDLRYLLADGKGLLNREIDKQLLENHTLWEVIPPETCAIIEPYYRDALAGKKTTFPLEFIDRVFEVTTLPVKNEAGEVIAGMAVSVDITERLQAEKYLRETETKLSQIAEIINDVFWMYNADCSQLLYVSPAYEKLWGYSCYSLYDHPLSWMEAIHPEDKEFVSKFWQGFLNSDKGERSQLEYRIIGENGQIIYIKTQLFALENSQGKIDKLVGNFCDITEIKLTQEYLRKFNQELEKRVEERTYLLKEINQKLHQENQERLQAEKSLEESEERLINLIDNIPGVVYRIPYNSNIAPYISENLAVSRQQLSKFIADRVHYLASILHPEDVDIMENNLRESIAHKTPYTLEYRIVHQDESIAWLWEKGQPVCNEKGEVECLDGVIFDISDRHNAEIALQESNQRFRAIFEQAAVGIAQCNLEGKIITVNQKLCDILGYSESELREKTYVELTEPEDMIIEKNYQRSLLSGASNNYTIKKRYFAKKGEIIWVKLTVSLLRNERGEPSYFLGIIEDIRPQKRIERELKEREQQLAAIASNLPGGVYRMIYHSDGHISCPYFSAGYGNLLGINAAMLMANPKIGLEAIDPRDRGNFFSARLDAMQTLEPSDIQYRIISRTGEVKWILDNARFSCNEKGDFIVDGVSIDITDRVLMEEALKESNERFSQLAENIDAVFWISNPTLTEILYISRAYQKIWGRTCQSLYENPQSFMDAIHPDDRPGTIQHIQNAIQEKFERSEREYRIIRGDGEIRWIFDRAFRVTDERGKIRRWLGISSDITERKKAEDLLRHREKQLETIVTNISDGLLILNKKGIIKFLNPAATTLLDRKPESLLGEAFGFPVVVDNSAELGLLRPNGELGVGEMKVVSIVWEGEEAFLVSIGDITDRREAEDALRRSEEKYRDLADNMSDGIYLINREFKPVFYNPAIARIFERPVQFFMENHPTNYLSCVHQEDRERVIQVFFSGHLPTQRIEIDYRIVRPSSEVRYVRDVMEAIYDHNTEAFSYQGILSDITERKLAEKVIRDTQERFQFMLSSSPAVIYTCDVEGIYACTFISDNVTELLGYAPEEFLCCSHFWRDRIHPEDAPSLFQHLSNLAESGHHTHEYRFLCNDGIYRWLRDEMKLVRDPRGQPQECIGSLIDITKRKLAEEEVLKALAKEKELVELKSRFVSMTSHEFRTPLTVIKSSAQLLERYEWSREEEWEQLQQIQTSVKQMTQLLEDVLTIGKADAGKLNFNPKPLELISFCHRVVAEIRRTTNDDNKPVIHLTIPECLAERNNELEAFMDEKLLRQILINLLSNAIKYSPNQCIIDLKMTKQEGEVIFEIKDQGLGIPPEDKSRLFDSFHRARNVGTIPGTGLGLAIVKKCVDLHRGTINFTSEVGKGTTFKVTLPLIS